MPAKASKRVSSNRNTVAFGAPSIFLDQVALDCQPSPPREQPLFSERALDHLSLTLSLGSNTEDEHFGDHEQVQHMLDSHQVHLEHDHHLHVPAMHLPRLQTPPAKCYAECFRTEQKQIEHDTVAAEICCTDLLPVALPIHAGSSSVSSTANADVNGAVASSAQLSMPSSCIAFCPSSSWHSMVDSRVIMSHSGSYQLSTPRTSLLGNYAATALPPVASGHIIPGMLRSSRVSSLIRHILFSHALLSFLRERRCARNTERLCSFSSSNAT